jgi:glycosyltransferase involved in cell wall biosynthesis/Flp pilus assembly protein TadD
MNNAKPDFINLLRAQYYYAIGLANYLKKNWYKSELYLLKSCKENPYQAKSYYRIGLIFIKQKKLAKAYTIIRKSIFLEPNQRNWISQLRKIEAILTDSKQPKSGVSENEILCIIDKHKQNSFLYYELAKEFRTKGKWGQEIEALKQAVKLEKGNPDLIYKLGEALARMKKHSEASLYYEQSIKIKSTNPEWFYSLGYSLSCEGYDGLPNESRSMFFYKQAIVAQKDRNLHYLGIGIFHQHAERWELAAQAYTEQLNEFPGDSELLFRLGMCHDRQYKWQQAETFYEKAIAANQSNPAWHYRLGFVRERYGNYDSAATAYGAAAELENSELSHDYYYRQGYVLENARKFDFACLAYEKMTNSATGLFSKTNDQSDLRFPHDRFAEPWIEKGKNFAKKSNWSEAIKFYKQAIARKNDHDPYLYHQLGNCQVRLGLFQEACDTFRQSQTFQRAHGLSESPFRDDPGLSKLAKYIEFSEIINIQEKTVFYESFKGLSISGNPYTILLNDVKFSDWNHVWSIHDVELIPENLKNLKNVIFISPDSEIYLRYLSSAHFLINDDSFPAYFIRRNEQVYLNTWHEELLQEGSQTARINDGSLRRNLLQATHILSPAHYTSETLIHQTGIEGLAHGEILEDGLTTQQLVEQIIFGQQQKSNTERKKRSILIYGGNLVPTGITTSLINLLHALDYSKFRVFLILNYQKVVSEDRALSYLAQIHPDVQVITRADRINVTLEEKWVMESFTKKYNFPNNQEILEIFERAHIREFHRLLGSSRFDATIHFEGYSILWASILGCTPQRYTGFKTIYQHNDLLGECKSKYRYLENTFYLYRHFDRIMSVSKMTMDLNISSLAKTYQIPESKFDYTENIIHPSDIVNLANKVDEKDDDFKLFNFDGPVFLTIGRLSIEKDHLKLIKAFTKLRETKKSVRLLIIGDGPLMPELKKQIKILKQERNIYLLGFKQNPFSYLKKADCFVLSSNHEGQPMVLLEAITLMKPIIATDIAGSRSVIEGRSGKLVENSVDGLTLGMLDFLNGQNLAKEIDINAYLKNALNSFYQKVCCYPPPKIGLGTNDQEFSNRYDLQAQ